MNQPSKLATKRRVAVTGLGAVTPLGHSMGETWHALVEGANPCGPIGRFDATQFPCQIGYEVRDFAFRRELVTGREDGYLNPAGRYGVQAVAEALTQAGIGPKTLAAAGYDPARVAVCL